MQEPMKTIKKHFIESFTEIFDDPLTLEKVFVWLMTLFTIGFGAAAVTIPILLHSNHDVSSLVFLSYIVTIPIIVVLIDASANWFVKVYQG